MSQIRFNTVGVNNCKDNILSTINRLHDVMNYLKRTSIQNDYELLNKVNSCYDDINGIVNELNKIESWLVRVNDTLINQDSFIETEIKRILVNNVSNLDTIIKKTVMLSQK